MPVRLYVQVMITAFLLKILPLYAIIILGWLTGRFLHLTTQDIAKLLIYIVSPVVFFGSIGQLAFTPTLILCMMTTWIPAFISMRLMRKATARLLPDAESRVVASASALSNGGYFGIPLYILFFGEEHLGIWMLISVGSTFFEITLAYYQMARANFSPVDSVKKLMSLPVFWGSMLGLAWSASGYAMPLTFLDMHREFRGAYIVLGMMLIGISLSTIKYHHMWTRALGCAVMGRFILYPILMTGMLYLERTYLGILTPEIKSAAFLFGFLPVAANTIAYTAQLGLSTQLSGSIVFVTTILCTIFVPIAVSLMPA